MFFLLYFPEIIIFENQTLSKKGVPKEISTSFWKPVVWKVWQDLSKTYHYLATKSTTMTANLKSTIDSPASMNTEDLVIAEDSQQKTSQSWLLRLFESKMFDASMAVHYLFNSKEPGVLSYLGE